MADSRGGKRFPLALPITIHDGKSQRGHAARTTDLSAAGAYISASPDLEVGTPVKFAIIIPSSMVGSRRDVEIQCRGRVVRRDAAPRQGRKPAGKAAKKLANKPGRKKVGLAVVIDYYKFTRK